MNINKKKKLLKLIKEYKSLKQSMGKEKASKILSLLIDAKKNNYDRVVMYGDITATGKYFDFQGDDHNLNGVKLDYLIKELEGILKINGDMKIEIDGTLSVIGTSNSGGAQLIFTNRRVEKE